MSSRDRLESGLDAVAPVIVAACVLAAAAGSSIQQDIVVAGRPARWLLIGLLLSFALVRAALCLPVWQVPPKTAFVLFSFCGLALASVAWSVNPRGTLVRAVGVAAVIAAVAALAGCVRSRPVLAERLLDGVLAAAAVVAFAGFAYWLISPGHAAIPATAEYGSRYQGIEENPNTAAVLLAIGLPLALSRALWARNAAARTGFVVVILGFAASIVASGSRSGLLAGFVGLLTVTGLAPIKLRARVAVALLIVGALALSAWATTIPKALPAASSSAPTATTISRSRDAENVLPLSQEIGSPWWTHRSGDSKRSLFNTSVRTRAWVGTFHRALERPLLGYGFGAEQWAFVNRYYAFSSENPENGYLGLFLQLGMLGPLVFLLVVALCVVPGIRAARREPFALTAVGAAAAGLTAGISQSYFHGPGSIAFVALWVALLLAGVARVTRS